MRANAIYLTTVDAGRKIKFSVATLSLRKKRNGHQVREIPHQVPTLFKGLLENFIFLPAGMDAKRNGIGAQKGWQ